MQQSVAFFDKTLLLMEWSIGRTAQYVNHEYDTHEYDTQIKLWGVVPMTEE